MNGWVNLLQTFGLATAMLFFFAVAAWKIVPWLGIHVVGRIVDKYIELLDSLITSVNRQGEAMAEIALAMGRHVAVVNEAAKHTTEALESVERITQTLLTRQSDVTAQLAMNMGKQIEVVEEMARHTMEALESVKLATQALIDLQGVCPLLKRSVLDCTEPTCPRAGKPTSEGKEGE